MIPPGRVELLVIGNLNVDRIFTMDRIPSEGRSVPVTGEAVRFGGCGGNIALAAARLGVRTRLSSVVGTDLDHAYLARIVDAGIDTSDVMEVPDLPTPYCIVLSTPTGGQAFAFRMGAMSRQANMEIPDPEGLSYCHAATSDPAYCERVLRAMKESGVRTALDPGQEIYFRWDRENTARVLEHTDLFFGNLREWSHLGGMMGWEPQGGPVPVFPEAFDLIGEAVVTLGGDGAALVRKTGVHIEPAFDAGRFVDATGAGDAFRGAYYAALTRGLDGIRALAMGNRMGGYVTGFMGPQEYSMTWDRLSRI